MNCHQLLFLGLILLLRGTLMAQTDSIFVYSFDDQSVVDTMTGFSVDSSLSIAQTAPFLGSDIQTIGLPQSPPDSFPDIGLSLTQKAQTLGDVQRYPLRTAVRILGFLDGDTAVLSSGSIVGDRWVMGISVCFRQEASPNAFFDSVLVYPAFDNGRENTDYGKVQVAKAYYFSTTEKQTTRDPIVLLELEQAIGNQTGWLGMAYHADSSFYQSLNMHKASYISQAFPWDSSFQYRFDSMYYHYGRLDWFPLTNLSQGSGGLRVRGAFMLEGQAGSTFFYQDSTDSSQAFTIGIGTYASGYRHYRIRQKTFFVFAQIMSSIILSEEDRLETSFEIFPNPAASQLVVRLGERQTSTSISLWDLHGRIIARWEESRAPERVLDISEISPGFYLLRLEQAGREISSQKIMIR